MSLTTISNSVTNFSIVIEVGGITFAHTNLKNFSLVNSVNKVPSGFFEFVDIGSDKFELTSGKFGIIKFVNTAAFEEQQESFMQFIITDSILIDEQETDSIYRIEWEAGNFEQLKKVTRAHYGSSVEAMDKALEAASIIPSLKSPYPSGDNPQPRDEMTWRHIKENLWEQLNTIVNKSHLKNDYIYWAWDDTDGKYRISSFRYQMAQDDKFLMTFDENAVGSTENNKIIYQSSKSGKLRKYLYSNFVEFHSFGDLREYLFPNVGFSTLVDKDNFAAGFESQTFREMLQESGDDALDRIMDYAGLSKSYDAPMDSNLVYGEFMFRRHWPNYVHDMYSFADIYRNYKYATYSKGLVINLVNDIGPPLGSKVYIINPPSGYKLNTKLMIDTYYSDAYILKEKEITYNVVLDTKYRGEKKVGDDINVKLTFGSDNILEGSPEHIKKFIDMGVTDLGEKKGV